MRNETLHLLLTPATRLTTRETLLTAVVQCDCSEGVALYLLLSNKPQTKDRGGEVAL